MSIKYVECSKLFDKFYQRYDKNQIIDFEKRHKDHSFPEDHKQYEEVKQMSDFETQRVRGESLEDLFDNVMWDSKNNYKEINENITEHRFFNKILKKNFTIRLNNKTGRVFMDNFSIKKNYNKHKNVQGQWPNNSSHVLSVFMNKRLEKIARNKKLNIKISKEYLLKKTIYCKNYNTGKLEKSDIKEIPYRFNVIAKELDLFDEKDTDQKIKALGIKKQKELATTICRFIWYSGFMDLYYEEEGKNFNYSNIRLTKENEIAITSSEGINFLYTKEEFEENLKKRWLDRKEPRTLNDARITGLKEIFKKTDNENFKKVAKKYLTYAYLMRALKISTIVLSVLCPLIPLAVFICSVAHAVLHNTFLYFSSRSSKKVFEEPA